MNGHLVPDSHIATPAIVAYSDEPGARLPSVAAGSLLSVGFDFRESLASGTSDRHVAPLTVSAAEVVGLGVEVVSVSYSPAGLVVANVLTSEPRRGVLTARVQAGGVGVPTHESQLAVVLPVAEVLAA